MTSLDLSQTWSHYPMGPTVRDYIGIQPEQYRGESHTPSKDEEKAFAHALSTLIATKPPATQDEFVNLLEEFTGMRFGHLSIQLAETYRNFVVEEDFRALLALGSALMLEAEIEEAAEMLKGAQNLEPNEPAPYNNLAEIYYHLGQDDEALHWAKLGLRLQTNRFRLWEIAAAAFIRTERETAGEKIRELAKELRSFAGLSLAAELISPGDAMLKAELLEALYDEGERSSEFLTEYTAALGMARQYEKIPPLLWEAEKFAGVKPPWQLYAHAAQAQLALEKHDAAQEIIAKIAKIPGFPEHIRKDLETVYEQMSPEAPV